MIYLTVIAFVTMYFSSLYFAIRGELDMAIWLAIQAGIQLMITKFLADE